MAREWLGNLLLEAGRFDEAAAQLRPALVEAETQGRDLAAARRRLKLGNALLRARETQEAEQLLSDASREAAEAEDPGSKSPEVAAALEELKETLKRKEEGLV